MRIDRVTQFIDAYNRVHGKSWWYNGAGGTASMDAARLALFTLGDYPAEDSAQNVNELIDVAANYNHKFLVVTRDFAQFVGGDPIPDRVLFTNEFKKNIVAVTRYPNDSTFELKRQTSSEFAHCATFRPSWYVNIAVPAHRGVYNVKTGERIADRRQVIQHFWDMGFITRRGRPLSVASDSVGATREEIIRLGNEYERVQHDMKIDGISTEYRRRIRTTYNAISKDCAWPGVW